MICSSHLKIFFIENCQVAVKLNIFFSEHSIKFEPALLWRPYSQIFPQDCEKMGRCLMWWQASGVRTATGLSFKNQHVAESQGVRGYDQRHAGPRKGWRMKILRFWKTDYIKWMGRKSKNRKKKVDLLESPALFCYQASPPDFLRHGSALSTPTGACPASVNRMLLKWIDWLIKKKVSKHLR